MDNASARKDILKGLKRIVIKIGSSVIARKKPKLDDSVLELDEGTVSKISACVKRLIDNGYEVVLVSSGAVMAGRGRLDINAPRLSIPEKQACAAIGQSYLMRIYEKRFEKEGLKVAQILFDHHDLGDRKRYLNAKNTINTLLSHGVIPIINENDTVSVDEIKIGDNDTLAALSACLVDSQLLIILSDIDGLYSSDPSKQTTKNGAPPELIPFVENITSKILKLAGKSGGSHFTVGGMYTKVLAAKKTTSFGIPTIIMNGKNLKSLEKVTSGENVGTLFWLGKTKIKGRKHWIAHTLKSKGKIRIDAGAKKAIFSRGKSLLSAGIVEIQGDFEFGNAVSLLDESGKEFAVGLVNYNSRDLDKIKGLKTPAVREVLHERFYEEVIHRNDLVLL
jgi:glutamate 5-kinase